MGKECAIQKINRRFLLCLGNIGVGSKMVDNIMVLNDLDQFFLVPRCPLQRWLVVDQIPVPQNGSGAPC